MVRCIEVGTGRPYKDHRSHDYVRSRDVRRAFQIWERQTGAQVCRGLGLSLGHQHVGGVLGSLNGQGIIEREGDPPRHRWVVKKPSALDGSVGPYGRMPARGRETARRVARDLAARKSGRREQK